MSILVQLVLAHVFDRWHDPERWSHIHYLISSDAAANLSMDAQFTCSISGKSLSSRAKCKYRAVYLMPVLPTIVSKMIATGFSPNSCQMEDCPMPSPARNASPTMQCQVSMQQNPTCLMISFIPKAGSHNQWSHLLLSRPMPSTPVRVLRRAHVAVRLRLLVSSLAEHLLDLAVLPICTHPFLQVSMQLAP